MDDMNNKVDSKNDLLEHIMAKVNYLYISVMLDIICLVIPSGCNNTSLHNCDQTTYCIKKTQKQKTNGLHPKEDNNESPVKRWIIL